MKKAFPFGLFAIVALAMPLVLVHAETPTAGVVEGVFTTAKPVVTTPATPAPTPETPITELSLTARKAKAETDLRAIATQFGLFATRTQLTIDRLTAKGIDTTVAQTELTTSLAALDNAKTNLDVFAKIAVTDDMSEGSVAKTELKSVLTKIQDNLKDTRTHLINSLTALKASVTTSIDAQLQP